MYCFFYAIAHLRLADAVLLNYSLPLFMPFIERVWLREPFPRRLWWGVGLGFLGVLVILRPGPGIFQFEQGGAAARPPDPPLATRE
jgi:drug/metabolite transporter (DMT)-like permease